MIKISVVDAYSGMNEVDFKTMDYEEHLVTTSSGRNDRDVTRQFFLREDGKIILEYYWDGELVHTLLFHNKAGITACGNQRLAEYQQEQQVEQANVEQAEQSVVESEGENLIKDVEVESLSELSKGISNDISSLGVIIEDLKHARSVLGKLAADAKDKQGTKLERYFLWDNNDALQTVDSLMFHLLEKINAELKQIDEKQTLLHELVK